MSAYLGDPGGPRDPATPGGYCLARCRCGTCPQYAAQAATTEAVRQQEYAGRDRKEGERIARRAAPRFPRTAAQHHDLLEAATS